MNNYNEIYGFGTIIDYAYEKEFLMIWIDVAQNCVFRFKVESDFAVMEKKAVLKSRVFFRGEIESKDLVKLISLDTEAEFVENVRNNFKVNLKS